MDATRLMNRTDTKYVLTREELFRLLPKLASDYFMLEVDGVRRSHYTTQYYDRPNYEFYHVHQNGKKNRVKVRLRKYVDSELTFLEVKHKNNKGRTIKFRKRITDLRDELSPEDLKYIEEMSGLTGALEAKLTNSFERITLVHKEKAERLTFDLNLSFDQSKSHHQMKALVIAELKQEDYNRQTLFAKILKRKLIRPERISKYCLGVALLEEDIKKNQIKSKLRKISLLENNSPI